MAQKGKKTAGAVQVKAQSKDVRKLAFGKTNMTLFVVALVVIALGFVTLAFGSDTLAPILLVLGYCVINSGIHLVEGQGQREGRRLRLCGRLAQLV